MRTRALSQKSGYLPSLDGLRAISILSVIQFHDTVHRIGFLNTSWIHQYGALGVTLFFNISGVLICSRLLDEERVKGSISLKGFYIRRLFRISPPAWVFLIGYLSLCLFRQLPLDMGGIVSSFLMVRNLWIAVAGDGPNMWYTIHFWSLSVEEHFYLLLPALLIFTKRRALWLGLGAAFFFVWIFVVNRFSALQAPGSALRTDIHLQSLLLPAMFAVLLSRPRIRTLAVRWLHPEWVLPVFLLFLYLFALLADRGRSHFPDALGGLTMSIGLPAFVVSTMLHAESIATRVLEWAPLRFVGRISFSLYLWQQLFFPSGHTPAAWPFSKLQVFPLNYVAAFACAIASYYLVERPMIRVGHRLAHPVTPGHQDLTEPSTSTPQASTA